MPLCCISIRLLSWLGAGIPKDSCFHPPRGLSQLRVALVCCSGVPNSQLARAQQGRVPRGSAAQLPAAGGPWDGIPARLSSSPLSPVPDLLFLTGLASSVFVVSELVKLCERRCCPPKHTKGRHNWLRLLSNTPGTELWCWIIPIQGFVTHTSFLKVLKCSCTNIPHTRDSCTHSWAVCRNCQSGSWFEPRAGVFLQHWSVFQKAVLVPDKRSFTPVQKKSIVDKLLFI